MTDHNNMEELRVAIQGEYETVLLSQPGRRLVAVLGISEDGYGISFRVERNKEIISMSGLQAALRLYSKDLRS